MLSRYYDILSPAAERLTMERRKSPRMDVILKVRYRSKEDFQEALIRSISEVGVFLATTVPFDVGYQFLLEIHLPQKKGVIRGKCQVVWVNQIEAEEYPKGMGVKFLDLSESDRTRLEGYLDELRTQGRA
jgi:uncharacterized protein (TIGR02266 family)